MKNKIGQFSQLMFLVLFLVVFSFISCDNEKSGEQLTPEVLYQTSWQGAGHCDSWVLKDRNIGIQFVDSQKGIVNWQDYHGFAITYTVEGKYIKFNDIAFQLAGAPWVIKSYTKNHMILVQNESSPNKDEIATIELDKID